MGRMRSWKSNVKRGRCEIRLPFWACEGAKGNVKRKERRSRLPLGRMRSWKSNVKRREYWNWLLVIQAPRKEGKASHYSGARKRPLTYVRRQDAAGNKVVD